MIKGMTVKELRDECNSLIESGFGDYEIAISRDDEGNGYHTLFYTFITDREEVRKAIEYTCSWHDVPDTNNLVILG